MTHPPSGPSTPTPPPGPRQDTAEQRRERAAVAGSYGQSAGPLAYAHRLDNYRRQNGGDRLTARQARRIGKKLRTAIGI